MATLVTTDRVTSAALLNIPSYPVGPIAITML